jgi:hypothetical protein
MIASCVTVPAYSEMNGSPGGVASAPGQEAAVYGDEPRSQ